MTNLIEQIRRLFQKSESETQEQNRVDSTPNTPETPGVVENRSEDAAALNAAIVKNLMEMLEHTHENVFTCEETFALLDEYVELIADDEEEEAAALMPYVKTHLDKCSDCHNVYEILLHILQSEPPSPETAN